MSFAFYDLGYRRAGQSVRVSIDHAANVMLLDNASFMAYRSGQQFRYYGGHYTRSPIQIPVPQASHWHVVIDPGGGAGTIRSSVSVL